MVLARARPEDKALFCRALQAMGKKVACVGDGTSDVEAFQQADVGISMACGTDECKMAANVVLENDKYSSILQHIA